MGDRFKNYRKNFNPMVNVALAVIFLFGINSFLYINNQKILKEVISRKEAIRAISISGDIDEISFKNKIEKKILACNDIQSDYCKEFLSVLIQLKNRIYDYKMLFLNVLDFKEDSKEIASFINYENSIDLYIGEYFGLSPKNAKKLGIVSLEEYVGEIYKINLFDISLASKNKIRQQVYFTINKLYEDLNNYILLSKQLELRIVELTRMLKVYLSILITLDIALIFIVIRIILINKFQINMIHLNKS